MYLSIQEFVERVGLEFTTSLVNQRLGEQVNIDDEPAKELLNTTLTYASDVIDTYLKKVYELPLTDPSEVKYVCEVIGLQMLFIHTDEEHTKKYALTIEDLQKLATKQIELKNCVKKRMKIYR